MDTVIEVVYSRMWQVWLLTDNCVPVGGYETKEEAEEMKEYYINS